MKLKFRESERGASLPEYCLLLAVFGLTSIGTFGSLGTAAANSFSRIVSLNLPLNQNLLVPVVSEAELPVTENSPQGKDMAKPLAQQGGGSQSSAGGEWVPGEFDPDQLSLIGAGLLQGEQSSEINRHSDAAKDEAKSDTEEDLAPKSAPRLIP